MIIGAAADEVIKELGYVSSEKNLQRRNVIYRMDMEWRSLLAAALYMGTQIGGEWRLKIDKEMTEPADNIFITRSADVLYDDERGQYYSVVPTEFISYHSFNGIRRVKPIRTNTAVGMFDAPVDYVNQIQGAGTAYGLLESAKLGGAVGYEIESPNIRYNNYVPGDQPGKVLITYLPTLTGLKETDRLNISSEFAATLLDRTRQAFMMLAKVPEDKTTDNVSN